MTESQETNNLKVFESRKTKSPNSTYYNVSEIETVHTTMCQRSKQYMLKCVRDRSILMPTYLGFDIVSRVCNMSNKTGVTSAAGTAYPSISQFTSGFSWCSFCSIFSFLCSVLQIIVPSFVFFLLATVLPVLL